MTDREIDKLIAAVNGGKWWPWFKWVIVLILLADAWYVVLLCTGVIR